MFDFEEFDSPTSACENLDSYENLPEVPEEVPHMEVEEVVDSGDVVADTGLPLWAPYLIVVSFLAVALIFSLILSNLGKNTNEDQPSEEEDPTAIEMDDMVDPTMEKMEEVDPTHHDEPSLPVML